MHIPLDIVFIDGFTPKRLDNSRDSTKWSLVDTDELPDEPGTLKLLLQCSKIVLEGRNDVVRVYGINHEALKSHVPKALQKPVDQAWEDLFRYWIQQFGWNHLSNLQQRGRRWESGRHDDEIPLEHPEQKLLDIFNNLPSPEFDVTSLDDGPVSQLIRLAAIDNLPPGFKTSLYKYQQKSLTKMMAREAGLVEPLLDLRLVEYPCLANQKFWLDTFNFVFFTQKPNPPTPWQMAARDYDPSQFMESSRPTRRHLRQQQHPYPFDKSVDYYPNISDCRGGIVADRMGSGKTCTALALIAWTAGIQANVNDCDLTQQALVMGVPPRGDEIPKIRVRSFLDQVIAAQVMGTGELAVGPNQDMIIIEQEEVKSPSPLTEPEVMPVRHQKPRVTSDDWMVKFDAQDFEDFDRPYTPPVKKQKTSLPTPSPTPVKRKVPRPRSFSPPSLLVLAAKTIIDHSLPWQSAEHLPEHLANLLNKAQPFYYKWYTPTSAFRYDWDPPTSYLEKVCNVDDAEVDLDIRIKMHVSATTLAVIPDTLLVQWQNEIAKHMEANTLSYIVIDKTIETIGRGRYIKYSKSSGKIPEPEEMSKYDLVIISHSRFGEEAAKSQGFTFIGGNLPCQCPYKGNTRERDCKCELKKAAIHAYVYGAQFEQNNLSPLCRMHWKRVIVDEGHHFGVANTGATVLASRLVASSYWGFTGTPLKEAQLAKAGRKVLQDDLKHLQVLFRDFLKLQPFYGNPVPFISDIISKPFKNMNVGGYERLQSFMTRLMLRNKPEDIDAEVELPPLSDVVVRLPFHETQRMVYNALIAGKDLNAIDSERVDEDYFFHPKNTMYRKVLVDNLRLSCFWFMSLEPEFIEDSLKNAKDTLRRVEEGRKFISDQDRQALHKAIFHLQEALSDPGLAMYKKVSTLTMPRGSSAGTTDLGFIVKELPSLGMLHEADMSKLADTIYGFLDHPEEDEVAVLPWSDAMRPIGQRIRDWHTKNNHVEEEVVDIEEVVDVDDSAQPMDTSLDVELTDLPTDSDNDSDYSDEFMESKDDDYVETIVPTVNQEGEEIVQEEMTEAKEEVFTSLSTETKILGTTSSKLDYLVQRVKQHLVDGEKVLVYCHFNSDIYYTHMAFKAAQIPCLLFHGNGQHVSERSQNVTTFQTSETLNVMIMLLNLAAEGVDLSKASRVYFLGPVWQAAKRRQAVSRAWRIGCTKPVFVETLLIKHSLEDDLITRQVDLQDETRQAAESSKFQEIIVNADYIPKDEGSEWSFGQSWNPPLSMFSTDTIADVDYYDRDDEQLFKRPTEMKKTKTRTLPSDKVQKKVEPEASSSESFKRDRSDEDFVVKNVRWE